MEDFLTTRQTQDILKVDRITIYRMLNDGRLKGTKIGQQWRFSRSDVESLLNGTKLLEDTGKPSDDGTLPVHCLQTIQDLFTAVSQYSAALSNLQGDLITSMSNPCSFCKLFQTDHDLADICRSSRIKFIEQAQNGEKHFTCHAGLHYAGRFVTSDEGIVGLFLVGGYLISGADKWKETSGSHLLEKNGTQKEKILTAFEAVPVLPDNEEDKMDSWAAATAHAFESILQERSSFARRLKKIADLTQIP
jgi:excisionase family DNA binding protein